LVYRRDLVFLERPLTQALPTSTAIGLAVWGVSIVCLLLGVFTPLAALVSYRFVTSYFQPDAMFSYHADMLYVPASLLLVFSPTYRCWSIDRLLWLRLRGKDLAALPVPRLFQNALILFVLGLMYFDSTLYKLRSPFWVEGLGFWLPASFPSFTTLSWNALLNQEFLVRFAGYLTLVFEFVFIFVFWVPRFRIYLFVIGLALHLGIALVFPIPLFGLLVVAVYLCFFPDPRLDAAVGLLRTRLGGRALARAKSDSASRPAEFLKLDRYLGAALLPALAIAIALQATITFDKPLFDQGAYQWLKTQVGIAPHRVFGQWQFTVMSQDIALVFRDRTGKERWIPWITKEGHVGWEGYGRFWSFWWLTSLPGRRGQGERWARAAEAWAKREGISLAEGMVVVKRKPVLSEPSWEKDRHQTMEQLAWTDLLRISWSNGSPQFSPVAIQAKGGTRPRL
jgi:hypothetical protein